MNWRKVLVRGGLGIVGVFMLLVLCAYVISSGRLAETWDVPVASVETSGDSATIAHGRHVASIRGCVDCHGQSFGGRVMLDEPPIGTITASNLTAGEGGIGATYTDTDWVRALRSGVAPDGDD